MEPFQILGNLYIPDDAMHGYKEFGNKAKLLSDDNWHWDYRAPHDNVEAAESDVINSISGWHIDGSDSIAALILWANEYPTEIRLPDGTVVSGEPYDVVLINNLAVKHRVPKEFVRVVNNGEPTNRYWIRGYSNWMPTEWLVKRFRRELLGEL